MNAEDSAAGEAESPMLATIQPACHSERSEVEESALSSFPVILNEAKNPFLSCRPQAASLPTAMTGVRVLRLRSGRQNRTRFPAVILSEAKRSRRIRSFLLSRHSERSEESVPSTCESPIAATACTPLPVKDKRNCCPPFRKNAKKEEYILDFWEIPIIMIGK